jgi:hypothetical protein
MVDLFYFSNSKYKNIFTIPIDDNYIINNSEEDYNNNTVFRINYLENLNENLLDDNSLTNYQQNFSFSTMLKKNWKNKIKKFLGKSIFKYKKLILFVEKKRNHVMEI